MKIIDTRIFEGRNIYCHKKCVKMEVDLEGYGDIPSKDIDGFNEKLVKLLPELNEHRCGIDEEGGFVKRLKEGTYLAHISEHIIIALQNKLGINVCYGKAREISGERYYIIYQYEYKNTAVECGEIAVYLINSLINKKTINIGKCLRKLKDILSSEELGASTLAILNEAKKRGIPEIRLGEGSIFQLGYGKNSRIIEATIGFNTSAIGVDTACDKLSTKYALERQCLPIAPGKKVNNALELLFYAEYIGYPIVLKPRYGNQGKGVITNINSEKEALKAYNTLSKEYSDIIMEKHIEGRDYRVCVVDGKVEAAAERIAPFAIGDGLSTVRKLINELNKDERRGEGHEKPLTRIRIDENLINCLSMQNYTLDSIPQNGHKIMLRQNANLSTGGIAVDCTDEICKENIDICIRAAKAIGLDICGIDICCSDIGKPIDGAIIEVNAAPGIRMHHYPYSGKSRNVSGAIIDMLFKNVNQHIPVIAVTGTNGKTTTTRLIGHVLSLGGYNVGMTTTGGIYVDNRCIEKGDTTGYDSALTVLTNKDVDAAVLECARGGIIRNGLAYDLADVGVITNITEDHLGLDGINSIEDLAFVKSLIGEAVRPDGHVVINGDDKVSATIIERMKGNIIIFSKDINNFIMRKNIESGGYGVYTHDGVIYVEKDGSSFPIVRVEDIKITLEGKLAYNVENAMAACAALVGLGIEYSAIRDGFISFKDDEKHNPGRFNMYNINGFTVVLDYGHNIEGYRAVLSGAKKIKHNRLIGVIGVPGDRTDSSIIEVGKIAGKNFDYIYIKEDKDKRGRKHGETAGILKKGVFESGFNVDKLEIIMDESEALSKAIDSALPGDMIIIFFEKYEPLVKIVKEKISSKSMERDETLVMA